MTPYYDDGSCVIYHGDCRGILPGLSTIGAVMVTDPPYGIGHSSGWDGKFRDEAIVGDDDTTARDDVLAMWDGPAIVFGTWKRPRPIACHTVLVWDKGPAAGMGDLSVPWKPNWEEIYIIGSGFHGRRDSGVISGQQVVTWSSGAASRVHPNEKPVGLMRDLISKCRPLADIVDPFIGSGTTLRAAKDLGRRSIGIEIDERYCEIAAKRLAQEVLDLGGVA